MTEHIVNFATSLISFFGYGGVAFLMALESMVAPVPSEAVMPFAGFLIYEGKFGWAEVTFFSTLGSIIGSTLSYLMGFYGGKPFVKKFGKYLLLDTHHLEMTEKFFIKYGDRTIFISRFIPVVRHLISIPAGIGKMNYLRFSIYTILGAGMWNAFLAYLGFLLKSKWWIVKKYSEIIDIFVVLFILITLGILIHRYLILRDKKNLN
jgi:membrane protein DedA with SNARE-associated domain